MTQRKHKRVSFKEIELRQFRSFCVVAREQNFKTAAEELGLSRPAVWQQVRALERELGATLLSRRGRFVELTPEGRLLLDLVQPYVNGLESLPQVFATRQGRLPEHLTVASTLYLLSHHLLEPVRAFTDQHPAVLLNLRECLTQARAVRLVERGQADLAVVPWDHETPRSPNLQFEQLFQMQYTLVTSSQHPLARKKEIKAQDLVKYPMILGGSTNRKILKRYLQRHNVADLVHGVLETRSSDVAQKYVATGIGIALLFLGGESDRPPPGIHRRPLDTEGDKLAVNIVYRKGIYVPPIVHEFKNAIRKILGRRRR